MRGRFVCVRASVVAALLTSTLWVSSTADASEFLISNYFGDTVGRYDASGAFLGNLTGGTIDGPLGTQIGPDGMIYVASELNNQVQRYNSATGVLVDTIVNGTGLSSPTAVTFDSTGNMLVANFDGDSVAKYTSGGAFLGNLVTPGSGGLNGADTGTVVGPDGILYVPSFNSNQVLKYNQTSGAFLGVFAGPGGFGALTQPRTILFKNSLVYVASDNGNKVLRYTMDGLFVDTFVTSGSGGLSGAAGMAFGDDGNLYVASGRNNRVLRYNGTTGAFIDTFISSGLNGPVHITVVPEPFSLGALGVGLLMLRRRSKKKMR